MLKRKGFSVCGSSFYAEGAFRQLSGVRLLELFFPERLRLKREQKQAAEDAKRYFGKAFFSGQLRWHAIPFKASARVDELRKLLQDAVVAGKVRNTYLPDDDLGFRDESWTDW